MKFKKGDRVAVYGSSQLGLLKDLRGVRGEIFDVYNSFPNEGMIDVVLDKEKGAGSFHSKQCRRLVPRKKSGAV